MPWVVGGAIVGSALIGGLSGQSAARSQERAATRAADVQREGLGLQREMWETAQEQQRPWLETGQASLERLAALVNKGDMSQFMASPGYQWRLNQGIQAIDRSAAARGGIGGGGHLAAITDYGQNLASTEYGNYMNRLASLAGIGQTSAQSLGALGSQYAGMGQQTLGNIGQSIMAGGNAAAAAQLGWGNALSRGIDQGLWAYGSGMFNRPATPPPTPQTWVT